MIANKIMNTLKETNTTTDKTALREGIMLLMDLYMKQINDETLMESWLMCGVPDDSDIEEFQYFAEDMEMWHDCLRIFRRDVTRDEKEEGGNT